MVIELTPRNVAYVIFRRRRTVFGFLLICIALNLIYVFVSPWRYQSEAQVMVKVNFNNPDLARPEFGTTTSPGATVQSPQISDDVVKAIVVSYKSMATSQDIERDTLQKMGAERVYPTLPVSPSVLSSGTLLDRAIEKFDEDLDVSQLKESNILQISYLNQDPRVAQEAVQTLLSGFIGLQQKVFRPVATPFLEGQLDVARQHAQSEDATLRDFKVAHQLSSVADERAQLLQQRTDIADNLDTARSSLGAALARKQALDASLRDFQAHATASAGTDAMSRQLDDAQARLTAQIERANAAHTTYPDGSPFVVAAEAAVTDARKRLHEIQTQIDTRVRSGASPVYQALQTDMLRNEAEVAAAQAQVTSISKDIAAINSRLAEIDRHEGQLRQLESRVQVAQDNLTTQLQRVEESRISSDLNRSQITSLTVVEQPTLGFKVVRPRWKLSTALSLLLGLFGGVLFGFMRESLGDTFGMPEQLENSLRLPVLGTLNYIVQEDG